MTHLFCLESEQADLIQELFKNSIHNQYVVLSKGSQYSDIAQYSEKYMNVHINTVRTENLDPKFALVGRGY